MRLDALLLADAVSAPPDGKFYIHGGGLSRLEVPGTPCPAPFGVFARLEVSDAELASSHHFRITLIGPTGLPNIPPLEIQSEPQKIDVERLESEQRFMQFAISLTALVVRVGLYHVELRVDKRKVGSVPLPVMVRPAEGELQQLLGLNSPLLAPARPKAKRPPPPPKKAKRRR
jgi:hypothetical protein